MPLSSALVAGAITLLVGGYGVMLFVIDIVETRHRVARRQASAARGARHAANDAGASHKAA